MRFEPGYLLGMVLQSVPEPRVVARDLFAQGWSRAALWQTLALLLVLTTMVRVLVVALFPDPPEGMEVGPLLSNPILTSMVAALLVVSIVYGLFFLGRAFGGTGTLNQALITIVWLVFVNLVINIALLLLSLFAPLMGLLLLLFAVFVNFWILTFFATEMHGFQSPGMVLAVIVVGLISLLFAFSLVLAILGFGTDPAMMGPL